MANVSRGGVVIAIAAVVSLVLLALVRGVLTADDEVQGSDAASVAPAAPDVMRGLDRPTGSKADLDGLKFVDVTERTGLPFEPQQTDQPTAFASMTAGSAVTRRSGRTAVLLTSELDPVRLVEWINGTFRDVTRLAGLAKAGTATAALFADLDGDGTDDLLLGHQDGTVLSAWRGDGRTFVRDTAGFGLFSKARLPQGSADSAIRGIAAADVNGDGRLDLVFTDVNPTLAALGRFGEGVGADRGDEASCDFANQVATNAPEFPTSQTRLYLGGEDGRFADATRAWGIDGHTMFANTPQLVDVNADGWIDLLITGGSCTSRVYLNDDGKSFDRLDQPDPTRLSQAHGALVRDFNGDGVADWLQTGVAYPTKNGDCPSITLVTGCRGNALLLGRGDGTFEPAKDDLGLTDTGWAFGAAAEDFANTGGVQVAITNGFTAALESPAAEANTQWSVFFDHFRDDPLAFMVDAGDGTFVDVATRVGLQDVGAGRSLLAFDYDDDGRLDLLVNHADTGPRLFRNVTVPESRHWTRIALDDSRTPTNRAAWGARVRVTAGRDITDCWITSNTSYETGATSRCHVGLGESGDPVNVDVWWPGQTRPQTFAGVVADRETVLRR